MTKKCYFCIAINEMIHTNDMKKYFILLALISLPSSLLSQQLEGNYKEKSDSLSFSRGKVSFSLSGFGALVTRIIGEGSYELVGDYLLIDTHEYPGEKSAVQILDGVSRDSVTVKVLGPNNYPLQGALLEYMSESGKVIRSDISNELGESQLPRDRKIRKIRVSNLGYDEIRFDVTEGNDFRVTLAKDNVIENQTVVLKISREDEETLSILLLTDNFDPGKEKMKALEKLYEKARKSNLLAKRLKKEYIPTYHYQGR